MSLDTVLRAGALRYGHFRAGLMMALWLNLTVAETFYGIPSWAATVLT